MMTSCDCEGQIFLSRPHTYSGSFVLLTTKYRISYWKHEKRLPINHEYTEIRHGDVILGLQYISRSDVGPGCGQCAAVHFLSFPWAASGMRDIYYLK